MLKKIFERKVANRTRMALVFAFCLLLIGNILSFISTQKVKQQESFDVTTRTFDDLVLFVTTAESAVRGYVITKDTAYIHSFNTASHRIDSAFANAYTLAENKAELEPLINQMNDEIIELVALYRSIIDDREQLKSLPDETAAGIRVAAAAKNNILGNIARAKLEEKDLQQSQPQNINDYADLIKMISIISTVIAILLMIFSIIIFNKENRAKKDADEKASVFRDELEHRVTELGKINSELIELRSMEKFVATGRIARIIAHEVRNPLTNINLAVEQLKTEFEGSEGADMFLDMIERNSRRINKLVSDLLDSTRLSELKKSSVSVNEILNECLEDAADRIKLSNITVARNLGNGLCNIGVEKEKIKIAFLNLIMNGIEAMDRGGTLTVFTGDEHGKCVIKIQDSGKGMSPDQLNRLFEPFFTTKEKGNGLGLANTHNIILSHDGSIQCESEEGKGTTFTILLDYA